MSLICALCSLVPVILNQNLNSWDVGSVTDMSYMLSNAAVFNQNVSAWAVGSVTNMRGVFEKRSNV